MARNWNEPKLGHKVRIAAAAHKRTFECERGNMDDIVCSVLATKLPIVWRPRELSSCGRGVREVGKAGRMGGERQSDVERSKATTWREMSRDEMGRQNERLTAKLLSSGLEWRGRLDFTISIGLHDVASCVWNLLLLALHWTGTARDQKRPKCTLPSLVRCSTDLPHVFPIFDRPRCWQRRSREELS